MALLALIGPLLACLVRVGPQILSVYSREENVGEELLSRVHMGRYRSDGYVWHVALKEVRVCLLAGGVGVEEGSTA